MGGVLMHLGNGAITPECVALTYTAAAAGLAAGAIGIQRAGLTREKATLAAALGCLVFAAQAINVPILPGTSAHLVGGVLLAWMLGPGLGAWTMALILAVQALALGDGGLAALGANVLNMALVPAGTVAAASRLVPLSEKSQNPAVGMGFAAGCAVLLAALLIVVETAAFRPAGELAGWTSFAALMLGTHAWIGVLEGTMTAALVAALAPIALQVRLHPVHRYAIAGAAVALVLAAFALPISSALPDGYEAAAQASGMNWLLGQ
jgi:cobalt/nickel transport system permease protein